MKRIKIPWKKRCLRVGCVSTRRGLIYLRRKVDRFDLIELRVDSLRKERVKVDRIERALRHRRRPVLLTLRTIQEGGNHPWKSTERIKIFERLMPFVDAIDIELVNTRLLKNILDQALDQKCGLVISTHSIHRKLTKRKIERLIKEFQHVPGDVYKIASYGRNLKDLAVLSKAMIHHSQLPLAIMAIGPMADVSRIILPVLGSKLVYGY